MAFVLFATLLPFALATLGVHVLWPRPTRSTAPSTSSAPPPRSPDDRTPEVRGRVLDADGNPVQNAAVRLVSPGAPHKVLRDAISDAAGGFSFARVDPQSVLVVADHDREGFVTSAEIAARVGESEEVTLVLSATRGVRGTVVDGERHPVAGATLIVEGVPWKVPVATSDESGAFRLVVVPDQATSLHALARGYRAAHVSLDRRDQSAELVVEVQLSEAEPVRGDVRGDDGEPVSAQVVACAGQPAEEKVMGEEDGSFELPPSTLGCEVVAHLAGYASSDPATVVEGRRLQLRLKTGGAIEGVVTDEHGTGLRSFTLGIEAFVTAGGGDPDRGPRDIEDAAGVFRWDRLAAGRYVLTASAEGLPPVRSAPITVSGGVVTRGVTIAVGRGGSVIGTLLDDRGATLADVKVDLDTLSSVLSGVPSTATDRSGRYRIEGAPLGPFTIRAQKDGYRTRLVSGLRVLPGGTLAKDIALTALPPAAEGPGIEFGGIGAVVAPGSGGLVFGGVGASDPAGRAGLAEGDRILSIDGESSETMSVADAIQRLRGDPSTSVGVSVERGATGQVLDLMIERAHIVR